MIDNQFASRQRNNHPVKCYQNLLLRNVLRKYKMRRKFGFGIRAMIWTPTPVITSNNSSGEVKGLPAFQVFWHCSGCCGMLSYCAIKWNFCRFVGARSYASTAYSRVWGLSARVLSTVVICAKLCRKTQKTTKVTVERQKFQNNFENSRWRADLHLNLTDADATIC